MPPILPKGEDHVDVEGEVGDKAIFENCFEFLAYVNGGWVVHDPVEVLLTHISLRPIFSLLDNTLILILINPPFFNPKKEDYLVGDIKNDKQAEIVKEPAID